MHTFLPFPDFATSAHCLSTPHLSRQRIDAYNAIHALDGVSHTWRDHPTVLLWKDHRSALVLYYNRLIDEWEDRGYKNPMQRLPAPLSVRLPSWCGDPKFHASHRSALLRKDPLFYRRYNWKESSTLPLLWPITTRHTEKA